MDCLDDDPIFGSFGSDPKANVLVYSYNSIESVLIWSFGSSGLDLWICLDQSMDQDLDQGSEGGLTLDYSDAQGSLLISRMKTSGRAAFYRHVIQTLFQTHPNIPRQPISAADWHRLEPRI